MEKSDIIARAKAKRLYKSRGKFLSGKQVGTYLWTFVLWRMKSTKKDGKTLSRKVYLSFSTTKQDVVSIIRQAQQNDRFKVRFDIESTLYNDKFYTNLMAEEILPWGINEDKVIKEQKMKARQTEMFEQHQYVKSANK